MPAPASLPAGHASSAAGNYVLNVIVNLPIDQRRMTSFAQPGIVHHQTSVDMIPENRQHLTGSPRIPASRDPAQRIRVAGDHRRRHACLGPLEHPHHRLRLLVADNQLLRVTIGFISEWDGSGDPSAMRFEMGARFGDSGGREISLELRERGKDAQHEFVEGGFAQSLGRHDFQCDVVIPQFFKQGDEVPQIPRQPVEAMDHELLDAARPDDAQQSVQGRPVEGRAGVAFVVKTFLDDYVAP